MNKRAFLEGRRLICVKCKQPAQWIVHFAFGNARVHELLCDKHADEARLDPEHIGEEGI